MGIMTFKAKLRRIGNSYGVITPKAVITDYKLGDVITIEIKEKEVITESSGVQQQVITPHKKLVFNYKKGINEWK